MGWTYAARCKYMVVAAAQRIDRIHDRFLVVGDDTHLAQIYANQRQHIGKMADVLVLGPAGEKLVADGEHGGGDDRGAGHGLLRSYSGRERDLVIVEES